MNRLREKLPFTARVSVPEIVRGAELEIVFAAKDPDATLEQTERSFSHFVVAAEANHLLVERFNFGKPGDLVELAFLTPRGFGALPLLAG